MSYFGEILKNLRNNAKMSQQELAAVLWVSKSAVSSYEQDRRSPSLETLIRITNIFHVSTDYLLGREQKRRMLDISDLSDETVDFMYTIVRFLRSKDRLDDKTQLT